jgi:flagellar biosynthetic protein FliR
MLVGNFLTLLGITLVFATDLHHLVIAGMNDSYTIFQPGEMPLVGDAAQHVTRIVATAFRIGIQLSAPFLVFGLLFNLGLGVLSRLIRRCRCSSSACRCRSCSACCCCCW